MFVIPSLLGYAVAQLVQAKSRKISDSIPDGVIEIFHSLNNSGRNMTRGLTHLLTELSAIDVSCG
jgi:hypothetical protein